MKRILLVLLALILGMVPTHWNVSLVNAQEGDTSEYTLEEITVTAEKREMDLQDVSRSIAVISAEDLDLRMAASVMDVLETTSGITFQGGFGGQLFVRGVGPAGSMMNDPGNEASVQFNIDGNLGMYAPGQSVSPTYQALNDVERIEVIRGPSGAVNGRMAASGTINVITKEPSFDKLDGNVSIQSGDYNTINTSAAMNIPLKLIGLDLPSFIENLSFRIAARQDKHSEYIHNSDGEGVSGSQNYYTFRTKMKWQPIERLTVSAQYTETRNKSNTSMNVPAIDQAQIWPPGNQPHPQDPWLNANGTAATERTAQENFSESVELSWATKIGTLTGRYSKSWVPVTCGATGAGGPPPPGGVCYEGDIIQKEYELRMNSPEESKIEWMAGAYKYYKKEYAGPDTSFGSIDPDAVTINFTDIYGRDNWFNESAGIDVHSPDFNANDPTRSWALPFLDPVNPGYVVFISNDASRPIDSYSFFGNITVPFFEDKHRFTLGLRKNMEGKKRQTVLGIFGFDENNTNNGLPSFTFVPGTDPTSGDWRCNNCYLIASEDPHIMEQDSNPITYTVGWEYDWQPEVMLYANINNGFKPGGVSSEALPNVYYEPEYLINYAMGTRSRWFGNTLQLNAEAFLMAYKNLQTSINTESMLSYESGGTVYTQAYAFQSRVINIGKTYVKGLELDYDWLISARDRLKGNLEFKDAKYGDRRYRLGNVGMPPGHPEWVDFSGRPMPLAPKFTFNASYSHQFTFGNMAVTPRLDAKYSSKYITYNEWWWEVAGAEIWQPAYWKYSAYLNVGPEDGVWQLNAYYKNISETVVRDISGGQGSSIQDPRTIGVGLSVRF